MYVHVCVRTDVTRLASWCMVAPRTGGSSRAGVRQRLPAELGSKDTACAICRARKSIDFKLVSSFSPEHWSWRVSAAMPSEDHCCVSHCTHRRSRQPNLSFHHFPKDDGLRRTCGHRLCVAMRERTFVSQTTLSCVVHTFRTMPSFRLLGRVITVKVEDGDSWKTRSQASFLSGLRRHLLAPHWQIVLRLELNVRVRSRRRNSVPSIADAAAAAAAAQSEGERQARWELAEAGKQIEEYKKSMEEMERRLALLECENPSLRSRLYSLLRTWKETTKCSAEHLSGWSLVQWEAFWKVLAIDSKEDILSAKCLRTRKEAGRTREVLVGRQWQCPLKTSCWWPLWESGAGGPAEAGIHFWCVGGVCHSPSRSGLVSCTWDWDDFCYSHLWRMWMHPWQSASVLTTLTHLLSWMPQSCAPKLPAFGPCSHSFHHSSYKSYTTLKGLIGISPNGSISFVSELWSGFISDRELVIKSGILPLLDHVASRERVMADRSFDIQDLVKLSCSYIFLHFKETGLFFPCLMLKKPSKSGQHAKSCGEGDRQSKETNFTYYRKTYHCRCLDQVGSLGVDYTCLLSDLL